MRKPIIAGNWKMNMSKKSAIDFINTISAVAEETDDEVLVCTPSIHLSVLSSMVEGKKLKLGAQNMHQEDSGAYTGEISADMLAEYGINNCIIGHSERRMYFSESDESVNAKLKKAHEKKVFPVVCVGESLEEKEGGFAEKVLKKQISGAFEGVAAGDAVLSAVAYEPIWAIGTGKTAAPSDAQDTIEYIRGLLEGKYGKDVSDEIRILYGGSVKSTNIKDIMKQKDIDGVLVGGASLDKEHFRKIIEYK